MNIVKGVADLIRRSSGGSSEAGSWGHADKLSAPSIRIRFSDNGEEAVLNALWQKYQHTIDKIEKRKHLKAFFLHFIQIFNNWEPVTADQLLVEQASPEFVTGCYFGHPSDVILILVQEIARIISLITELNNNAAQVKLDLPETTASFDFSGEALDVLNCMTIVTRSMHNCKVFSYYGGVQKVTALLKAIVVQLKALSSSFAVDESSSVEKIKILQKILLYVVSLLHSFIGMHSVKHNELLHIDIGKYVCSWENVHDVASRIEDADSDGKLHWQKKSIVMITEAGGVNWLAELLRAIRRLNMKEQWTDLSLHYLTLGTLRSALTQNPRAQNHFRSIGGLEVLLDWLGLPSNKHSDKNTSFLSGDERFGSQIMGVFDLQIFSLEVLRESVFGNLSNLQYLCENGRIHKFANSICWPAFMLQELRNEGMVSSLDSLLAKAVLTELNPEETFSEETLNQSASLNATEWNEYSVKLSRGLCSFLLPHKDIKSHKAHESRTQSSLPVSLSYWELSVRWIMKVLFTVFPCIKACSSEHKLPNHLRILANSLQHYILCAFRVIFVSAPVLLKVFRDEGIWDLIFSEKFFYFGSLKQTQIDIGINSDTLYHNSFPDTESTRDNDHPSGVDVLQVEAIAFLECAATHSSNTNNLPECSVLLDTLEQSQFNPEVASILLKSLHRIMQLSVENSLASFISLDAVARVLKVACIQAHKLREINVLFCSDIFSKEQINSNKFDGAKGVNTAETIRNYINCMEFTMELFNGFISLEENAKSLILHNSSCIDCLFDLFWEESIRKHVLEHVIALLRSLPLLSKDKTVNLHLCSKFLETFTRAKERERSFAELSIDLLVIMREIILIDRVFYQNLFHEGECFLHIVSLLNGTIDEKIGEQLVLNVLQTLTLLLMENNDTKVAFRILVGSGYQMLQNLLSDFCKWQPSEELLNVLLDMLVDGDFNITNNAVVKNEDVILLLLTVLQRSSLSLQHYGLDVFLVLLKDSMVNRTLFSRTGMLSFLLEWFSCEENDGLISKIAQLIQVVGGHNISGRDIRKIFSLLRNEKMRPTEKHSTLLLRSISYMLKEKGPEAFFEFSGHNSGIVIEKPLQWPNVKGFSFLCWLRVGDFPENGTIGLFSFLTDNGKGCTAVLGKDTLILESIGQKRQRISTVLNLLPKRWHFLCITHAIGRAFSGGSQLKCYVDGNLISSEKCRYAKVSDVLACCTIGSEQTTIKDESYSPTVEKVYPFIGQMGPIYMFGDVLSSEQIKSVYRLGPSYMYSFLSDEAPPASDKSIYGTLFDAKDGLSSKIIFGLNAQASNGKSLFNASSMPDSSSDKSSYDARIMVGTQLCSRRLFQEIIYCVGGVSVFFPLLTQFDRSETDGGQFDYTLIRSITRQKLAAEVVELIASVLDGNLSNQQHMHLLSGFSVLGFLFQSVPPEQLNMETLSALKNMLDILRNCGVADLLLKDAISRIYMNPHIWVYANYEVQRDLYMFIIQYFENDGKLLPILCHFPRIIDIIRQFYWDKADSRSSIGSKPLLHPVTKQIIGERPRQEEARKIRLLLLSLAEMTLRIKVTSADIKALVAFFERSQDMVCIEDVLHMVIRVASQKEYLVSLLEQVNLLGGVYLFVNLLRRELEPIRLLGLQFLGQLLVGLPSEKKGTKFLGISLGRSKSVAENLKRGGTFAAQPIFYAINERLFTFPLSDNLCATLFDVLLGGSSPKQALQKKAHFDNQKNKKSLSCQFLLPQILVCIFKFLAASGPDSMSKILGDLLGLLESNPSNIEALMENAWSSWLKTSVSLDVNCTKINELLLVRNVYCTVLSHYLYSVKGGWQQLEETINFLLLQYEKGGLSHTNLIREIFEDIIGSLVEVASDGNLFLTQPCRDNTLYLLRLVDELLISESGDKFMLPGSDISSDYPYPESYKDISAAVTEILNNEFDDQTQRIPWSSVSSRESDLNDAKWCTLYDKIWFLISEISGKGQSKVFSKTASSSSGPSLSQRARGLVESLNIPAAEMAAVVVAGAGGIGNALGGKTNKLIDKAMLLRGEKFPRVVFHLVIFYVCKASLEKASKCVQQFTSLLPSLLSSDDEHSKNRLHYFIWFLLTLRSQYGMLDDGARFHVISHLILESVNFGKSMLVSSILGREDSVEVSSNAMEAGSLFNLIQKDRVLAAVVDEAKYLKAIKADRLKQTLELQVKLEETSSSELNSWKNFEEEISSNINEVLLSDESRKITYQLAYDEDQQMIAEKWIHMFRALVDERGPWSANPFPNDIKTHWKLDKTEDYWRRRLKLKRNYKFDERLCHPPISKSSNETRPAEDKPSMSSGGNVPEQMKRFLLKGVRGIVDERNLEMIEDIEDTAQSAEPALNDSSENFISDNQKNNFDQVEIVQDRNDVTSLRADGEPSEVQMSVPCMLVNPKRKLMGQLAIKKNIIHFSGEFLVQGTGGSSVFNRFLESNNSDSSKLDAEYIIQDQVNKYKRHRWWDVSKIKAVHWTRYLLQYTAIEIFFNNSIAPVFLHFATSIDAKHAGTLLISLRNECLFPKGSYKDKNDIISFVDRRKAVEMAETYRESWKRRDITNFEYLMHLNTLAGRSYNDLTQYPVFPWILVDYSSDKLDLNNPSTFRDLSKPVGALDSKRFEVFEDRYHNFCDPDIPSFYYGSHYSSMGIVLFYLLRLEPFTALHRNLQGGKFDHADRLFQSIEGTYRNCLSNTSDVKELIPEFFYLPDFLVNSNSYHFGVKQDGEPLCDVVLPPWAKGSPEEFINKNREALESEYVSSNLHNWIDLVFGYKQRGKHAVEAANVFYYLTYEGAVDMESLDDPMQKSAIEDQIANFGQTPVQLFRKKHPRRGPPNPLANPLYYAPASVTLSSIMENLFYPTSSVLFVGLLDSNIVVVNQDLTMSVKSWLTTQLQSGGNFTFSGSQEPFFGIGADVLPTRKIGTPLFDNIEFGRQSLATMQTMGDNYIIMCGNWENSFQIISLNDGRMVQSIRHHKDLVSCVAVTSDGSTIATGSNDTTVMVWKSSRQKPVEKRYRNSQSEPPRKDLVIIENPIHILCGHDDIITCISISLELDLVISGSKDGTCVFHTLREGRYVRSIQHPSNSAISKLVASKHGSLVMYAEYDLSLHLYTVNGKLIASSESNGRLNSIELSNSGDFLVCAGDHGQVVLRSMHSLDVIKKYDGIGKTITTLTVTPEDCFLAGTKDGNLLVYSIENPRSRKGSVKVNSKSKAYAV